MKRTYGISIEQLKLHIEKPNISVSVPPIGIQANLLGFARSSVYYHSGETDPYTLAVMNKIDEIYTKRPFYGVRRITNQLHDENLIVNHKKVHHLMQEMGIGAIFPKKNLSQNNQPHPVYPYLLSGVKASHPNHIWGTDITYIRLTHGFLYLVAFLDWYSRFILSWKLSTTLDVGFVLEAAEEAIRNFGLPEIENSDQGVQFTAQDYLNIWLTNNVQISMDGRGRAMDNIFTERLWRTIKYEEVYLKSYESVKEARDGIGTYIDFYNNERFHQSLKNKTPRFIYDKRLEVKT